MSATLPLAAGVIVGGATAVLTGNYSQGLVLGALAFGGSHFVLSNLEKKTAQYASMKNEPKQNKKAAKQQKQKQQQKQVQQPSSDEEESEEEPVVETKSSKKNKKKAAAKAAEPAPQTTSAKGKKEEKKAAAPAPTPAPAAGKGKKAKQPEPEPESDSDSEEEEPKQLSKSQLKKQKQKEKEKAAAVVDNKKGGAAAAAAAAAAEVVAKTAEKAKKKAAKAAEVVARAAAAADNEGWTEVVAEPSKKAASSKKSKVEVASPTSPTSPSSPDAPVAPAATVLEFNVPSKHHPLLIGKGGETLKTLSAGTGAKIDMPKKDSGSLKVTITGTPEQVQSARGAIDSLIERGFSSVTHPGVLSDDIRVEEKLLGLVIGPKGQNLRAIQDATQTRINLPEKKSSSDRVVIVGAKENIRRARNAIKDLIRDGFNEFTNPGWIKEEIDFPKDKLAWLIGPKGHTIKSIQGNTKTMIRIPGRENGLDNVIVSGSPAGVAQAKKEINRLLEPVQTVIPDEDDIPEEGTWAAAETAAGEDALWD